MVKLSLLVAIQALFYSSVSAEGPKLPPTSGKFFYVDFDTMDYYGLHTVKVEVSGKTYDLFVSTNQYSIGLISKDCRVSSCDVPKWY